MYYAIVARTHASKSHARQPPHAIDHTKTVGGAATTRFLEGKVVETDHQTPKTTGGACAVSA